MPRRSLFVGFWVGLIAGVITTITLLGSHAAPRAAAQGLAQQPPAPVQRYQLSTWAYPAGSIGTTGSGSMAAHGAYVLDTQTGKVWQIREEGKPQLIGIVQ
jgi:hypothetical protein